MKAKTTRKGEVQPAKPSAPKHGAASAAAAAMAHIPGSGQYPKGGAPLSPSWQSDPFDVEGAVLAVDALLNLMTTSMDWTRINGSEPSEDLICGMIELSGMAIDNLKVALSGKGGRQ